jgi:hypothetical protein
MDDQHVDQAMALSGGGGHAADLQVGKAGIGFQLQRQDCVVVPAHKPREADDRTHVAPTLAEGGEKLARREGLAL